MADRDKLFPRGEGEMVRRVREFDWSKTPVGSIDAWPASLRTAVSLCLSSHFQIIIFWTGELVQIYNDAFLTILGAKHPDALGQRARECWAEMWEQIKPLYGHVFATGTATRSDNIHLPVHRHGYLEESFYTMSYTPIFEDGGVGGVFNVVLETTQQVVAERRTRLLRDLAARTAEATTVLDACSKVADVLARSDDIRFAQIYLLEPDDSFVLAGSAGIDPGANPGLAPAAQDGTCWPLAEVSHTRGDVVVEDVVGRWGPVASGPWGHPVERAVVLPLRRPGQERMAGALVAGVTPQRALDGDFRDFLSLVAGQTATAISNVRAYQEEKARAEALADLDRAKTAFFSNVSHEFRTPLTLMLGPVEELLSRSHTDLSPAAKGQLEVAHRNSLRLLRLVNTLLDFSRVEAGRMRAVFEPTDLAAFTAELASVFRSATERAGLALVVDCAPLPEPVYVDRDMWEKIVLNLVSNAFKFTFEGRIEVTVRVEGSDAILVVRDTGVGVPAEAMPRLFERFHRVQNMRSRTHEGSGIGLALVQELVKLHHGSVHAESRLSEGTAFIVRLPLGKAHLPAEEIGGARNLASSATGAAPFVEEALRWLPEAPDDPPAAELPTWTELMAVPCPPGSDTSRADLPRVLVADDNADMRNYVVRLLAERYSVEAVPDGQAALAATEQRRPDLILSDVMMPGLGGFELVQRLRADPAMREIPIVLLSARAGEESRVEGLQAGADDYLIKPFSARELVARVQTHLQLARVRREAAGAMRESEERFRLLVEDVKDYAIFMLAPDGTVTTWNLGAERLKGYAAEEILGRHVSAFHLPEDVRAGKPQRQIEIAAETGRVEDEGWRVRKDGSRFWANVVITALRDEAGRLRGFGKVTRDFTERRRAEEDLKRSREGLSRLAEASLCVMATTDVQGMLQAISEAALVLTGARVATCGHGFVSGQFVVGGSARVAGAPACPPGDMFRLDKGGVHMALVEGAQSIRLTDEQLRGHARWWGLPEGHVPMRGLLGARMLARSGQTNGMILVTDKDQGDFTAEDESLLSQLATVASLALQHVEARISLEEADRSKNQFLAMLSHELRNPLAPIHTGLFILDRAAPGSEQARRAQAVIGRQVAHLTRIVDDLLDVTRISRGKVHLQRESLDFVDIVRRVVEDHRALFATSGLDLQVSILDEQICINGDRTRVAQAIGNLLQNAWKFTQPGGMVTVTVEANGPLRQAVLRVRDTGPGIAPEILPRIFEPFMQADTTLDRTKGGLGLGLALAKGIMEMHGGTASVESEGPGKGAEFALRFPLETNVPPATEPVRGARRRGSRRRVLVVEDNIDAAESLREVLDLDDHTVEIAFSGSEGIAKARDFQPEVVLCDIGLPGMDGYMVARAIRADPTLKSVALVALTGYAGPDDVARSREAGFEYHLAKPPSLEKLAEILASLPSQPRDGDGGRHDAT